MIEDLRDTFNDYDKKPLEYDFIAAETSIF
jgi:hypothetical protein